MVKQASDMNVRNFKYEWEVDKEEKKIQFGDHYWDSPRIFTTSDVLSQFGFPKKINKDSCIEFTEKYGITPTNFRKKYNALTFEIWINPIKDLVNEYAIKCKRVSQKDVVELWHNLDKIRQVQKDGLYNLEPFAAILGKTPQEMREICGKALWRRLCKNSKTRNKYLAYKISLVSPNFYYLTATSENFIRKYSIEQLARGEIDILNKFPSWVLKRKNLIVSADEVGLWTLRQSRATSKDLTYYAARAIHHIARDTERMASQLGRSFSLNWDLEKMREKHEEYSNAILDRKYSKEPFEWLKDVPVKNVKYEDFDITLLTSPYEIVMEGAEMHHCVGSYSLAVEVKGYLVYHVNKCGEKYSTVGVNVHNWGTDEVTYTLSQHYGPCNSLLGKEGEEISDFLIGLLNKQEVGEKFKVA